MVVGRAWCAHLFLRIGLVLLWAGASASAVVGCGSSAPKPETPVAEAPAVAASDKSDGGGRASEAEDKASADAPASPGEAAVAMPAACADPGKSPCTMSIAAAKKICAKSNPDIAVALFAKDAPWTKVYVAVQKADSFNGLGGPSSEQKLTFDEELVVLGERKADFGGMSVSGAGASYDLMRWDGTCATLSVAEVTNRRPPKPKHATVPFRSLSDSLLRALREDARVSALIDERRKHCKGATMGDVTAACERADRALNDRIVDAVRGGLHVPVPSRVP